MQTNEETKNGATVFLAPRVTVAKCVVPGCTETASGCTAGGRLICDSHGVSWISSSEYRRFAFYADQTKKGPALAAFEDWQKRIAAEARALVPIDAGAFPGCSRYFSAQLPARTCQLHTDCDIADAYARGQKQPGAEHQADPVFCDLTPGCCLLKGHISTGCTLTVSGGDQTSGGATIHTLPIDPADLF